MSEPLLKASKKQNNRKSGKAQAKLELKRKTAQERQAKYNALTPEQKLAKATPRSREYDRLVAKMQK